jgi:antitoxin HicB
MYQYPVKLTPDDNGTIAVSFPDIPEAHTFGENREAALRHAEEALEAALTIYIEDRRDLPTPSRVRSRRAPLVGLPALSAAKVALYQRMRSAKIGKAELARRLHCHLPQIDRLLDLNHKSRLDQLEQAFLALGKRLTVSLEDAA